MSEPKATDSVESYRMSILDHIRELRNRLIISLLACVVGVVITFNYSTEIFGFLVAPMNDVLKARGEGTMAITDALEGVVTYLKVALLAGVFLASPVVFWQVWAFVAPGLYANEKKAVLPLVVTSTALFLAGAAFGYFVIFRYGFEFFLSVIDPESTAAVLSIEAYLSTATKLLAAFGLSFQLPVVVYFLARLGLVNAQDMLKYFRFAMVGIFVVAAILTPPDVVTQVLMAIPLTLLYVISIGVAWMFSSKKPPEPSPSG